MAARRLLSVAHSYCVGVNRRLAHEMARAGRGQWDVVAVAPKFVRGDLRPIRLERLRDEACPTEAVSAYLTAYVHVMLYGWRLREILRQHWDLVHCWEEPYVAAGWQVAAWTPKATPFVFWTAQNVSKRYPVPFSLMERYCLGRCAGWLACGQSTLDVLRSRGYDRKPHRLMPLGVDVDRLRPDADARREVRRRLAWDDAGPPVVGYLGRFVPEKGVGMLARVCDGIEAEWRGLFVGAGPLERELKKWARRHADRVRIVTDVPHDQVGAFLNAMDVLCVPSQTTSHWREQFGRVVVEAFACGVPVIGSSSGEIPHVVQDAGLLVGEADVEGWVRTLGSLLQSPAARADLAVHGRERARSVYAWPTIARQHLEFFRERLETASC